MQKERDSGAGPTDDREGGPEPSQDEDATTNGNKEEEKDFVAPFTMDLEDAEDKDAENGPPVGDDQASHSNQTTVVDGLPENWDDEDSRDEPTPEEAPVRVGTEELEDDAESQGTDDPYTETTNGDDADLEDGLDNVDDDLDSVEDVSDEADDDGVASEPDSDELREDETDTRAGGDVSEPQWTEEPESTVAWRSQLEREFDPEPQGGGGVPSQAAAVTAKAFAADMDATERDKFDTSSEDASWADEADDAPAREAAAKTDGPPRRSMWSWAAVACLAIFAGAGAGWLPGKVDEFLGRAVEPATLPHLREVESRLDGIDGTVRGMRNDTRLTNLVGQMDQIAPRIDRLESQVDALAEQISQIGARDHDNAGTEERLAAIEESLNELAKVGASISLAAKALEDRQDSLDATVGSQRRRLDEISFLTGAGRTVTGDTIDERFQAMESRIGDRVKALESRPRGVEAKLAAFVLAVGQLRIALQTDSPFGSALESVSAAAPEDSMIAESIAVLTPLASSGVESFGRLQRRFDPVVVAIVRAAAKPPGDTWIDKTIARLSELITVRRVGTAVEGDGADAVVARAEARLKDGELAAAVSELGRLDGAAAEAAEAWLNSANQRLAADKALIRLESRAIKLLESVG